MVTPELLRLLFQYNQWADWRLLEVCSALTNEQFTRDLGSSSGPCGIRSRTYMARNGCGTSASRAVRLPVFPQGQFSPDLASVRVKLEEMDRHYIDYVSKLAPRDLERVMTYKSFAGDEFSNPLWQSLHQLTNHATYHRGQAVTLLRQLGAKPVATDLIAFYREQAAAARA